MSEPPYSTDLFGNTIDNFKSALERYGVWPTTVWAVDHQDKVTRELKQLIGDVGVTRKISLAVPGASHLAFMRGGRRSYASERSYDGMAAWSRQTREGAFTAAADDESVYRGKVTASIFSPAVAAWLLNCFAPKTGLCFDPFAGGGTRAIMAAKRGLRYLGVELRPDEVAAVNARVLHCGITEGVEILCGDSRTCDEIPAGAADFTLTCPPYWTLEQYDGGPGDLSMIESYPDFIRELGRVVHQTARILKPGSTSCWVVGLHRDDAGCLTPLHHDLTRLHSEAGFTLREEIVLHQTGNGAIQRIGNFDKGMRRLIRVHEYAMVYQR